MENNNVEKSCAIKEKCNLLSKLEDFTSGINNIHSINDVLKEFSYLISSVFSTPAGFILFVNENHSEAQVFSTWRTSSEPIFTEQLNSKENTNTIDTSFFKELCVKELCEKAQKETETDNYSIETNSNCFANLKIFSETGNITGVENRLINLICTITANRIFNIKFGSVNITNRDNLTGLFNKNYLKDTLEREIHRAVRNKHAIGVILYDIDNLDYVNKNYSKEAGDKILIAVAGIMQGTFRGHDISCRLKDNKIIQILPEANIKSTLTKAEEVNEWINELDIKYKEQQIPKITVSIGIAAFPDHGNSTDELIQAVESALFRAKSAGKDQLMIAEK